MVVVVSLASVGVCGFDSIQFNSLDASLFIRSRKCGSHQSLHLAAVRFLRLDFWYVLYTYMLCST